MSTDVHESETGELEWFSQITLKSMIAELAPSKAVGGLVLLSTCNRFEIYIDASDERTAVSEVSNACASVTGLSAGEVQQRLRVTNDADVVRHLFSVASGLQSLVLGDAQISGQVKRALAAAHAQGSATQPLYEVFQSALSLSKQVSRETHIGNTGRSMITSALSLADHNADGFRPKVAVVIGTGSYARVVIAALERTGVSEIGIHSRSGRTPRFTQRTSVVNVGSQQIVEWMARADVVVAASGSPGYVVDADAAKRVASLRHPRHRLVFIDVSASRDIDPSVGQHPLFSVIDLPRIQQAELERTHETVSRSGAATASESVAAAQRIIDCGVVKYLRAQVRQTSTPTVVALHTHFDKLIAAEVAATHRRSGEALAHDVQRSLQRVCNTIMHLPTMQAKALAESARLNECNDVLRDYFGIEVTDAT